MNDLMPSLVSSLDEAKSGIRRFQDELNVLPGVVDLLSSFQSWYAIADKDGRILFGPSKFIGYDGLTAERYREVNKWTDGRITEALLGRWFSQPDTTAEQVLINELSRLLNRFGKKPNKRVRISTVNGVGLIPGNGAQETIQGPSPVDALLVLYRLLNGDDQKEFRRRINRET
ncbi:hypothetical protein [Zoogloea sp.]|uniref:hypothetical protein n=1 Tax=Zoogloea sp. TaxID=49181 RepID=UPI002623B1F9|nr:hypothetical protein [Zoogloea sp.]MDD3355208.1 hypothetical protein [Zoogloea sp.]